MTIGLQLPDSNEKYTSYQQTRPQKKKQTTQMPAFTTQRKTNFYNNKVVFNVKASDGISLRGQR